jgi:hypothetical protein
MSRLALPEQRFPSHLSSGCPSPGRVDGGKGVMGYLSIHGFFWVLMALAPLVTISGPKKVSIFRAHPL